LRPVGDETRWRKDEVIERARDTLDFCSNVLGRTFSLEIEDKKLRFDRVILNNFIDISEWKAITKMPLEEVSLKTLFGDRKGECYKILRDTITKLNEKEAITLKIFTDEASKESALLLADILNNSLKFQIDGQPVLFDLARELIQVEYNGKRWTCAVFVLSRKTLSEIYFGYKLFTLVNNVPSQFIDASSTLKPLKQNNRNKLQALPGVQLNFACEILSKCGRPPIKLSMPEEIGKSLIYLCLSDVDVNSRLFGIMISYISRELYHESLERLHIYTDVPFTLEGNMLKFGPKGIEILSNKIVALSENLKEDTVILLTREWKYTEIEKLVQNLEPFLRIKKVLYVSTRTARFVSSHLLNRISRFAHPFVIFGKNGFIFTNSEVRISNSLYPLYVEVMYPSESVLTREDLVSLLWLAKKRIYRIQEFFANKLPEPLKMFQRANDILGRVEEPPKLSFPLYLLL